MSLKSLSNEYVYEKVPNFILYKVKVEIKVVVKYDHGFQGTCDVLYAYKKGTQSLESRVHRINLKDLFRENFYFTIRFYL